MDLMYLKNDGESLTGGYLRNFEADFDITTDISNPTNDFTITMALPESADELLYVENEIYTIVYANGTEFGGEISGSEINIGNHTITYTGRTWRGTLSEYIIEPPSEQDYLTTSGNLADSLRDLPLNPLVVVQDTTYTGGTFQYNRYITVQEGATSLLKNAQSDLRMYLAFDEEYMIVRLFIAPATDKTALIEMSQDYDDKVKVTIKRDGNTPHHLICLGGGELAEREVVHLYADEDWTVSTTEISGAYPVETYEYSGSESLLSDGVKHYAELIEQHTQIDVSVDGLNLDLSDIIAARELITGDYVTAEITKIVYKCKDNGLSKTESWDYSTTVKGHTKESEGLA